MIGKAKEILRKTQDTLGQAKKEFLGKAQEISRQTREMLRTKEIWGKAWVTKRKAKDILRKPTETHGKTQEIV